MIPLTIFWSEIEEQVCVNKLGWVLDLTNFVFDFY